MLFLLAIYVKHHWFLKPHSNNVFRDRFLAQKLIQSNESVPFRCRHSQIAPHHNITNSTDVIGGPGFVLSLTCLWQGQPIWPCLNVFAISWQSRLQSWCSLCSYMQRGDKNIWQESWEWLRKVKRWIASIADENCCCGRCNVFCTELHQELFWNPCKDMLWTLVLGYTLDHTLWKRVSLFGQATQTEKASSALIEFLQGNVLESCGRFWPYTTLLSVVALSSECCVTHQGTVVKCTVSLCASRKQHMHF